MLILIFKFSLLSSPLKVPHCVGQLSPPLHSAIQKYTSSPYDTGRLSDVLESFLFVKFYHGPLDGPFSESVSLLSFPHHLLGQLEGVERDLPPKSLKAIQMTSERGMNGSSNSSLFLPIWAFFFRIQNRNSWTEGLFALANLSPSLSA